MYQNDNDTIQIGRAVIRQAELKIPVDYKGESFTLRYPNPAIQAAIEAEVARRLGGNPRTSFTYDHIESVEAYVTVDFLFDRDLCPKWFKGPWLCLDEELVGTLYKAYLDFREQFRARLRAGGFEEAGLR